MAWMLNLKIEIGLIYLLPIDNIVLLLFVFIIWAFFFCYFELDENLDRFDSIHETIWPQKWEYKQWFFQV